jgi:PEP-CTERM motif-containing protein
MSRARAVGVSFLFAKRAIVMGLPIAWILLLGSLPARSATIDISATVDIPENTTMLIGHTLTNREPSSYLFGNFTGLAFAQTNNDLDDKVTNVTIAANMCSGAFVLSGNSCTFAFRITTADTSGVNDRDVGQWAVTAQVQAQWFDITINNFRTDTFNINDTVNVTDPVPEPSTWAMMLIGFAGLGFAAHWRRRKSVGAFAVA